MVVLSKPGIEQFSVIKSAKPLNNLKPTSSSFPTIDLSNPNPAILVKACEDYGFFKVINHSIPMEIITTLESESLNFFSLPNSQKLLSGPANPFGYGNKSIGRNGDVGWVEYLLMTANNPTVRSHRFKSAVEDYVSRVRRMACELVELLAGGLGIKDRGVFSRLLRDEQSDSLFRLNHYPPCPELRGFKENVNLLGFGEHTDPQIVSVLRSNSTSGLEIELKNGNWVSVPSDPSAFFVNVGDSLQVMTNGRFKSVRHRVVTNSYKSRMSMIYFGGPPLREKIAPIPALLMGNDHQRTASLYKEFTWGEYKSSAYKSRLADNRLEIFQKKIAAS